MSYMNICSECMRTAEYSNRNLPSPITLDSATAVSADGQFDLQMTEARATTARVGPSTGGNEVSVHHSLSLSLSLSHLPTTPHPPLSLHPHHTSICGRRCMDAMIYEQISAINSAGIMPSLATAARRVNVLATIQPINRHR